MSAQALALHLDVEQAHQAAPPQDAVHRRLRMIWFFQGMCLAALVLMVGVAAMGHSQSPPGSQKPSGHLLAFADRTRRPMEPERLQRWDPTTGDSYKVAQRAPARHGAPVMEVEPAKDTKWNPFLIVWSVGVFVVLGVAASGL